MFEDQTQKPTPVGGNQLLGQPQNPFIPAPNPTDPASNQPVKATPEDMFAETERTASGAFQSTVPKPVYNPNYPTAGQAPAYGGAYSAYNQDIFGRRGIPWPKIITILIIIFVLVVGLGAVYGGYAYFKALNPTSIAPPTSDQPPATNGSTQPTTVTQPPATNTTTPPATEEIKDLDGDGLSDEEEIALGTKKDQVDTDVDGLTDWAEVRIYKTDPLNSDTDSDGYKDGQEVINGYDPLLPGSARLYEVPNNTTTN